MCVCVRVCVCVCVCVWRLVPLHLHYCWALLLLRAFGFLYRHCSLEGSTIFLASVWSILFGFVHTLQFGRYIFWASGQDYFCEHIWVRTYIGKVRYLGQVGNITLVSIVGFLFRFILCCAQRITQWSSNFWRMSLADRNILAHLESWARIGLLLAALCVSSSLSM